MYNHWNILFLDVLSRIASKKISDPYGGDSKVSLDLGVITKDTSYVLGKSSVVLRKDGVSGHCIVCSCDVTISYQDITGLDGIYVDVYVDAEGVPSIDCVPYMEFRRCNEKPLKFNMLRPKFINKSCKTLKS